MFAIDRKNNITISVGDTGIIDFKLCGEVLKAGDKVSFESTALVKEITEFTPEGLAKILISFSAPHEGCYSIKVYMKDGRITTTNQGKLLVKGGLC